MYTRMHLWLRIYSAELVFQLYSLLMLVFFVAMLQPKWKVFFCGVDLSWVGPSIISLVGELRSFCVVCFVHFLQGCDCGWHCHCRRVQTPQQDCEVQRAEGYQSSRSQETIPEVLKLFTEHFLGSTVLPWHLEVKLNLFFRSVWGWFFNFSLLELLVWPFWPCTANQDFPGEYKHGHRSKLFYETSFIKYKKKMILWPYVSDMKFSSYLPYIATVCKAITL